MRIEKGFLYAGSIVFLVVFWNCCSQVETSSEKESEIPLKEISLPKNDLHVSIKEGKISGDPNEGNRWKEKVYIILEMENKGYKRMEVGVLKVNWKLKDVKTGVIKFFGSHNIFIEGYMEPNEKWEERVDLLQTTNYDYLNYDMEVIVEDTIKIQNKVKFQR